MHVDTACTRARNTTAQSVPCWASASSRDYRSPPRWVAHGRALSKMLDSGPSALACCLTCVHLRHEALDPDPKKRDNAKPCEVHGDVYDVDDVVF